MEGFFLSNFITTTPVKISKNSPFWQNIFGHFLFNHHLLFACLQNLPFLFVNFWDFFHSLHLNIFLLFKFLIITSSQIQINFHFTRNIFFIGGGGGIYLEKNIFLDLFFYFCFLTARLKIHFIKKL